MKKLTLLSVFLALPVAAQIEPYGSASVADFSKAGYVKPYWDLGAGVEANSAKSLFRLDGYWSPTRKDGVPGSATTLGGSFDGFYKAGPLLIGGGTTGGETRTGEFVSHGWRYMGEAGFESGAPDASGGRIRAIARYVGPINDPHDFYEIGLTLSARWRHFEPLISFTRFTTDVTRSQYSAQVGVRYFPFSRKETS